MSQAVAELVARGMGDWEVAHLEWKDHTTLRLGFRDTEDLPVDVEFFGISRLNIEMEFNEYVGLPLIFSASNESMDRGFQFTLMFGAQPNGQLTFRYVRSEVH